MDGLELESLRCFEVAARELNFRAAAQRVSLSPAAFGQRIARLERALGAPLFARTTRRVTLTPAGLRALPNARVLLAGAEELRRVVRADGEAVPYELTLATRFELGISWLTPALSLLERRRPERTLHLEFGNSADLVRRTLAGDVDCVVTSQRMIPAGLRYGQLHEERYVFVQAPEEEPLTTAGDAAARTLLDIGPELPLFRYFLDTRPAREAWSFGKVEYLGTIGAILHRVREGAGVAVLPLYFVTGALEAGELIALFADHEPQRDAFRLLWRAEHPRERELEQLCDELRELPLR